MARLAALIAILLLLMIHPYAGKIASFKKRVNYRVRSRRELTTAANTR